MGATLETVLGEARAALRTADASGARRALAHADDTGAPAVLECLARSWYLDLDFDQAIDTWEHAYASYRAAGDGVAAVRVARTLAYMHGLRGDRAVMSGWLARAQTLLRETPDASERGWVALNVGMFSADRDQRDARFREAVGAGREAGDVELELVATAYLGANLVHGDRTEEGMMLLDEALAAVAGREVDDFLVLEEIFCQLFSACEHAHDVTRADQWIRVGDAIARKRNLPAVSAFCHTHYGGILTAAGRWPEADATLTEAVRLWGLGHTGLRGGALLRLADLRVRQGRFEDALALLRGMEDDAGAARPLAAIHLARGDVALARDVLDRAIGEVDEGTTAAVPLLGLRVDVHLAAGDIEAATADVDRLVATAAGGTDYVRAVAALARGRVCLAGGTGDPLACLREALAGFGRAHLPMELARARLALANALVDDRPAVAMSEARAALDAFEQLQAARDVDAASATLRSLGVASLPGPRSQGVLTKREGEVLDLLGCGLSNPEIAERLYISRKTVEHHVASILSKLGLRSRAEAAAHAARAKPAGG